MDIRSKKAIYILLIALIVCYIGLNGLTFNLEVGEVNISFELYKFNRYFK